MLIAFVREVKGESKSLKAWWKTLNFTAVYY